MDLYSKQFFVYYIKALVLTFFVSSLFFAKVLFSKKKDGAAFSGLPFQKILLCLFAAATCFFYAVFLKMNLALSADTFMGYLIYNLSNFNFWGSYTESSILSHIFYSHIMLGGFLLVPFFKLISDFRTILFIQSIFIAFGVFPVFWLAEKLLKDKRIALAFSLAYLLHPSLHFSVLYGTELPLLALPFTLLALYFLFSNQTMKFLV
jgi:uncharacterized membrane protein